MQKPIWYILVAVILFLLVILLDVYQFEFLSITLELLLVPAVSIFYFCFAKDKSKYLSIFLVLYSISDIINIIDYNAYTETSYFLCNSLYILAYIILILYITLTLSFKIIFKKAKFDFIVLVLINAYIIYVIVRILLPVDFESNYTVFVQIIELVYSLITIIALSLSFLNFSQNTLKKDFYLFVSCLLITFSELVLIGYYYIIEDVRISYLSTVLFVSGVLMLLFHAFISTDEKVDYSLGSISSKT